MTTDRSRDTDFDHYAWKNGLDNDPVLWEQFSKCWNAARADMVEELCKQLEECTGFITCREDAIALIRAVAGGKDD